MTVSRSCARRSWQRYKKEFDIPDYDAEILTGSKHLADLFEETTDALRKAEKGIKLADGRDAPPSERGRDRSRRILLLRPQHLASLIELLDARHDQPDRCEGGV